jgi:hypothetical protein
MGTGFSFPFSIAGGRVVGLDDQANLRAKIIQLLFTTPGERVNEPEFGCGLLALVFEPSDSVLAAALEFTIGEALVRWLGDEILVDGVSVSAGGELVTVEVAYTSRRDLSRQAVRLSYS